MRRVFDGRDEAAARGARARTDIEECFSEQRVAEIVRSRLALLAERGAAPGSRQSRRRPPGTKGFPGYRELVERVRSAIEANTPPEATVAIVSRGDELLLEFAERTAWHFPRNGDGGYAGYYPTDSTAAIAHLEQLRANGATHLAIPASSSWWLEHYDGMREHLEKRYEVVFDDPATATMFRLAHPRRADSQQKAEARLALLEQRLDEMERRAAALDRMLRLSATWSGALVESAPRPVATRRPRRSAHAADGAGP
jgi:hypothetical protein